MTAKDRKSASQRRRSRRSGSSNGGELTIDRLARKTGMTARNIRAHQSRGLLPPPEVRGRVGYYGPEHVARLELIKEMQADGFNLEAIALLLGRSGGSSEEVLRFTRALREPFADEHPRVVTVEELAKPFGDDANPEQLQAMLENALEIGFLHPLGDGRFEEISPRLAAVRQELFELGISPQSAIDVGSVIREHADAIARAFAQLFLKEVWEPFDKAGRPAEDWPKVREALERLRPLASEAVVAIFGIAMGDAVDEALGEELDRLEGGEGS
ncbi:MAG TPA: MerR family transcriptional regulator [Solirubrobacterales bacterium]|nr:MerR family transcriptional regulator [Solirubrobacterales bacterium]